MSHDPPAGEKQRKTLRQKPSSQPEVGVARERRWQEISPCPAAAPRPTPAQAFHSLLTQGEVPLDPRRAQGPSPSCGPGGEDRGRRWGLCGGRAVARDPGPPWDWRALWSPPAVCATGRATPAVVIISRACEGLVWGPGERRPPSSCYQLRPCSGRCDFQSRTEHDPASCRERGPRPGFPRTPHRKLLLKRAF